MVNVLEWDSGSGACSPKGRCAMKLSDRNVFKDAVVPGVVNSEVTIDIGGGVTIVSIISKNSVDQLGLKPGSTAYAIIKASNVIVGAD